MASSKKLLIGIIMLLLLVDGVILVFFILQNRPAVPAHRNNTEQGGMYEALKKDVHFSTAQLEKYQALRKEQFTMIKPLFGEVRKSKENFYSLLMQTPVPDSLVNALSDSIGYKQKNVELQMFSYFEKLRALCTPEQLPRFDTAMKKVVSKMTGRQGKGRQEGNKDKSKKNHN